MCHTLENLSAELRRSEVEVLVHNARLIYHSPDSPERTAEAQRLIRQTMYRFGLQQITEKERQRILDILRPCCPDIFFAPPPIDERLAASLPVDDDAPLANGLHLSVFHFVPQKQ